MNKRQQKKAIKKQFEQAFKKCKKGEAVVIGNRYNASDFGVYHAHKIGSTVSVTGKPSYDFIETISKGNQLRQSVLIKDLLIK